MALILTDLAGKMGTEYKDNITSLPKFISSSLPSNGNRLIHVFPYLC